MTLKTKTKKQELLEIRKKHFLPTAFLYYKNPIQLVKAKGNYVWDEEGKEYLDAIGGIVCNSAGHNHPKIQEALIEMIKNDEIQHTSTIYINHHPSNLAKKILSEAPEGIDRCSFTNSGSEANELAIMASRNATGESMIINLKHGYHGGTSGTLASCGQYSWRFRAQVVASVAAAQAPYCYRCPFNKSPNTYDCHLECAKDIENTIQTATCGKIAGFIAEPVMGIGGVIVPPNEYFSLAAKIVHNYGGKYISDEVQTGSGRCGGNFLLTKELNIDADIITMAKGFGNGAPIGAVLMKSDIADLMSGKLYFNTFGSDPYQTMQALKTMEIIEEENLIKNAKDIGKYLIDSLNELKQKHQLIGDVRGRGLLIGIELVKDKKTKEYANKECIELMELTKDKGLLIGKGGLFGNVIRIAPALSINRQQADFILKIIDESLKKIDD